MKRLIRKEFDSLSEVDILIGKGDKLIKKAKKQGYKKLAEQMQNDLNI